jgi:hypothetical protein
MTNLELAKLLTNTTSLDVEIITDRISEMDCYGEKSMRATISKTHENEDDESCVKFHLNYEKFREFNKQFESSSYYGKDGMYTATELGIQDANQEDVYADNNGVYFRILSEDGDRLRQLYLESDKQKTYVCWLEDRINLLERLIEAYQYHE